MNGGFNSRANGMAETALESNDEDRPANQGNMKGSWQY